jgi:hypothetical protein
MAACCTLCTIYIEVLHQRRFSILVVSTDHMRGIAKSSGCAGSWSSPEELGKALVEGVGCNRDGGREVLMGGSANTLVGYL